MTEPAPEPPPYPWLAPQTVLAWLKVDPANTQRVTLVEVCRMGAASWIEDQRKDLVVAGVFVAKDRVVMAGLLATARLFARTDSPNGVVSFDELGTGSILSKDPDVMRQLGRSNFKVG
ncbi:hypothetical protein NPS01_42710 [Nocardioides psychrotolerans]|uniref:Uncharacterized protein n=1 Tax=Nocardioides psychrotolerans TaxID=1005945 RepID=A0A1I3MAW3_9ACTN|nr:hypothetical protein [Nocardioides psychrotolerans]GEP40608.1 hypothetical protein NPS01_42710 [Nocardioides psychrotolerans]SFI94123.1 hypothetical protein SAMN05216561_11533 [Nocardioides psychrotolerans]